MVNQSNIVSALIFHPLGGQGQYIQDGAKAFQQTVPGRSCGLQKFFLELPTQVLAVRTDGMTFR